MNEAIFLETLGMMIVTSAVLLVVARRLSVPSIVVFIVSGLILGPASGLIDLSAAFGTHHAEGPSGAIALLSHLGIALLLFLVGLELSLDRIKTVGKVAAVAGAGQVSLTAGVGFGLVYLLGFSLVEAAILAVALTFSSTVVVVKLVGQKKEADTLHGRIAIGILLVQDLVVIIALTFLAGFGGETGASGAAMAGDLLKAFGGMAVMLLGALICSKYLLPKPFMWASRRPEMLLMWSLALCFASVVAAESLGLSPEIGAFLAGMSLAQLDCSHDLIRRLQSLMNFFIAVFFVTLGAQMQLSNAGAVLLPAIALTVFVLLGKPTLIMLVVSRLGYSKETAFKSGFTLAQISEFSFIFAAMAKSTGLVGDNVLAVVAIVGLSTIIVSSYLIIHLDRLHELAQSRGLLRMLGGEALDSSVREPTRAGHVIVIGMNTLGRQIIDGLLERGEAVLAIDTDPRKLADIGVDSMMGNVEYRQVLEEAGFEHARLVVSTLHIEATNNLIAYHCEQADVPCAIHGFDAAVHDDLRALNVEYIIDSKRSGIHRLAHRLTALEEAK